MFNKYAASENRQGPAISPISHRSVAPRVSFAKKIRGKQLMGGFTLIEILLVIGIIAVLATVVIVALDPATRFQDARDSRRLSDIQSILSAVQQYIVDNRGSVPPGIDTVERQLGTAVNICEVEGSICNINSSSCLDIAGSLVRYLKSVPFDPQNGSDERTRYSIQLDDNNIVTVRACDSTDDTISEVSR